MLTIATLAAAVVVSGLGIFLARQTRVRVWLVLVTVMCAVTATTSISHLEESPHGIRESQEVEFIATGIAFVASLNWGCALLMRKKWQDCAVMFTVMAMSGVTSASTLLIYGGAWFS